MPFLFLPCSHRVNLPPDAIALDVSSYADWPYCTLSPMWQHGGIPVPGMPGTFSDSVEGVWQGLKVIRGDIATRLFRGPGKKRGGKPSGHRFGKRLLGLVEVREMIFRVAYEWMLDHKADQGLLDGLIRKARGGATIHVHDVGDNGNIADPDEGWAHAAVFAAYLNRRSG